MADPVVNTTTTAATTQYPDWWKNYSEGLINTATQIASQPYSPYQGPTVAPLTALQQQAMAGAGNLQGSKAAEYGSATSALDRAAGIDISAAGTPGIQEGMALARQAAGVSSVGAAQPYLGQASNLSTTGAAQPYITGAMGALGQATNVNVPGSAQPYLNTAGQLIGQSAQSAVPGINQYMNPYNEAVVSRVGQLAGRNLQENLLPRIGAEFTGMGQSGSDRAREFAARAVRDTQESALAQQSGLLSQGYGQALTAAQADLARQGQLAATSGQLGNVMGGLTADQQRAFLQSGATQGQLGQTMGNLTASQQNALLQAGQTAGQLTGADATRQLQAGQELRTSGGALGQLAEAQAASQRAAAAGYGTLAGQMQGADLEAMKAQMAAGAVGQAQTQRNFDAGLAAFNEEKNYPQDTLANLIKTVTPLAPPGTSYTSTNVPYNPPTASQNAASIVTPLLLANRRT